MTWLINSRWVALVLMFLAYTTFGWYISQSSIDWSRWLSQQGEGWGWFLEEELVFIALHFLAAVTILGITFALTYPVSLMTIFFGNWLKSDLKAMFSVLAWSFAFVLMIRWGEYFVRFLVLLCAALLTRFELREVGYNNWQTFAILALLSVGGFAIGVSMFVYSHQILTGNFLTL